MSWNQNDIAFKTLVNKRQTDSNKQFYEEFGDNTINIHLNEIWINDIPVDSSNAEILPYSGYIDLFDHLTLIVDPTVPNNLTWAAVNNPFIPFDFTLPNDPLNPRLKDWISDKYGAGYDLKLYSNGTEIQKTSAVYPWRFDYMTGILTFNVVPPAPIQITGYRYNGVKGIIAPTDASGTVAPTFQIYMTHNGVLLKDSSGNLEIINPVDSSYSGVRAGSLNIGTSSGLYLLNLKEEVVENLLTSYYIIDNSTFNGVYSTPPLLGPAVVNDASAYSNSTGDKCLYKGNGLNANTWFLQQIDSSSLSPTQTQSWNGPFWFNEGGVIGVYFGNSYYYGQNLTIYNYQDLYPEVVGRFRRSLGIQGNADIIGNLGVHGKIITEQLKLDPSFNGVLITTNGEVTVSSYPKSRSYNTTITSTGITSVTINHNLQTFNQLIAVYDPLTQEEIFPQKTRAFNSSILDFYEFPLGKSYDVIIIGY